MTTKITLNTEKGEIIFIGDYPIKLSKMDMIEIGGERYFVTFALYSDKEPNQKIVIEYCVPSL